LNYAGKFDATLPADGTGAQHSPAYIHLDSPHAKVPADAIIVADAHLLFNADFKRSGVDLILSKDDAELVLHDYFKGEKRAPLASPDGAHLTGDLVNALTGSVQYSQAGGVTAAASQVIGHVTKLTGNATAIRNGVAIILHQGDNVEKGDVVQSGADSTLGITFIDGTVFGLSSNARMVLNEMVYDPNGSNNSSLISLVAGTISFVAGETAKHGDMKIDTPVATMGIRGTAVLVEIDFSVPQGASQPDAKFQVLVEPDGTTGSYILFDKTTLQPIAVVNQAGQQININNGVVSTSASQLSSDVQKLISDVFQQKFASTDPNSLTHFTDSTNPNLFTGEIIKTASGITATPVLLVTGTALGSSTPPTPTTSGGLPHVNQPPVVTIQLAAFGEAPNTTHSGTPDLTFGTITFNDINVGDRPTVSTSFDHYTYTDAHGHDVTTTLNALQLADVKATEANLVVVQGPNNTNAGEAGWAYTVPDSAFDFLAAGEKLTLTYVAEVDSNFAPNNLKTLVPFTITVTGTNDVPVITTDKQVQAITFSGGTSTTGGPLISGNDTSGKFAFTDADLTDTHTVTAGLTSWKMSDGSEVPPGPLDAFKAALTASIAEPQDDSTGTGIGAINWQFADLPAFDADFIPTGQTLTLTYTVTLTDSQGATDTKTVEVTITGTDHAAEVWIHTMGDGSPDGLWSTAQNWETRLVPKAADDVIIITDQLHGLTPSFPVTIDASTQALANSVTMNDFDVNVPAHKIPELDIQKGGSLTIGGASPTENQFPTDGTLTLSADSILHNFGTINIGRGGDFQGQASVTIDGVIQARITNTGVIDVQGGTLNVLVGVANTDGETSGKIIVDTAATLALGTDPVSDASGSITGGTVTISGTLELQGNDFLKGGVLNNTGHITVTGTGNALDGETVTANHALEIMSGAALLLDQGTNVANSGGTITIDDGATLTLNGATITGGAVNDGTANGTVVTDGGTVFGDIEIVGASTIENAGLNNGGVTIESGVILTLDNDKVTGTTFTDTASGAIIRIDDGTTLTLSGVTINGGAVNDGTVVGGPKGSTGRIDVTGDSQIDSGANLNNGYVKIESGVKLTLDDVAVNGTNIEVDGENTPIGQLIVQNDATITNGQVTIDASDEMVLNNATINGGTVTGAGIVHIIGNSEIDGGATLSNSAVTVDAELTLDSVTVSGTIITDNAGVELDDTVTLEGGATIEGGEALGPITNNGMLEVAGSATLLNDTLTNASGGIIQVDDDQMLTLSGTEIIGGTIDAFGESGGIIHVTGASEIDGGATLNNGAVTVDANLTLDDVTVSGTIITDNAGVELDDTVTLEGGAIIQGGEALGPITNNGMLEVAGSATLLNDALTDASGGIIQVDDAQTLTLSGTEIIGGTINDFSGEAGGKIEVTGASEIDGGATLNGGAVTVESGVTLTLDNVTATGTNFTDTASGAIIQVDDATKLTLSGVTINGGTVNDGTADGPGGIIDVTGSSTIENANLNNGNVKIENGAILTLVDDTVSGTTISFTGTGETLKLDKATSFGGTIAGIAAGDTIDLTTTKVTAATFDGSSLTVTESTGQQTTYQISGAPAGDTFWFKSDGATGTNLVVLPNTLTLSPVAEIGVEGSPIALNLGVTVNGDTADHDSLATLVVSAIPIGATLSDGHGNSFTATADTGQHVDVHAWNLSSLTITPANDTNFTLTVAATEQDSAGYLSTTTTSTEGVTVDPTAPALSWAASVTATEPQTALGNLVETITGFTGDKNTTNTLTISGAPAGAVLSDGHSHSVTSDGSTAIDVSAWTLSSLTIDTTHASVPDGNFTLTATATEKDAENNVSGETSVTEQVIINPTAPTLSWAASVSGTEPQVALGNLVETITGFTGDSNSPHTLTISGAPAGAVLSDGHNHSVTSDGSTAIDVSAWTLTSLTIDTTHAVVPDRNFTLTATATEKDGNTDSSTIATATEQVTVTPEAPTVSPVAENGLEGTPIALNLGATANGLGGDNNILASVVVSTIPIGATLTDGTHSFKASEGSTSVDVHGWNLTSLTITPTDAANFSLGVAATEKDGEGNLSATTTATEQITVTPEAPTVSPVAESGIAGTPIALDLGVTVNGLTGDSNSLASLMVSTIPIGATLSDGHGNSFTASTDIGQQVDVHSWNFSSLTITAAEASSFTLNVAATEKDAEGNLSTTTTASEQVTVLPPYISFANGAINTNGIVTPQISNAGSTIELTNGHDSEAASWFANTVYSVASFTASFDYQATATVPPNGGPADGMAFILQDSSAGIHALGHDGSALGYGAGQGTPAISPSAAVEFNVFSLNTAGTAFATDGAIGNGGSGTYTPTGTFENGDEVQAVISYNGTVLTEKLTDLVTGKIFSTSYTVDLASVLGSGTAYVGFSAATGGLASTQTVSNFNFDPTTVTIAVDTPNGLDFQHHDVLGQMGAGTIQPGGSSTSFTIVDSADDLRFVVDGSNLAYGPDGHGGIAITGGTLTSFHEFTNDNTPVALADFNGLPSIDAVTWMNAVQAAAHGDKTAIDAITSTFSINFIGGSGPDSFGSSGQADTLSGTGTDFFDGGGALAGLHDTETGGAGSTFAFQAGYGALTITNFDQAGGAFNATNGDIIQLNGLTAPQHVTFANGNTILDFGNNDVITLLNVSQTQYQSLNGSEFATGGDNGGGNNGPVFSSFTLAVTQGGTTVLTNNDFNVSDPGFTNLTYTVNNVTGGHFELNGVLAGTGGFTTADIAAGHVRFVQDGTPNVPNFTIHVSDGSNASPNIAPTVLFNAQPWGRSVIPEPNSHLFNAIANVDPGINTGAIIFSTSPSSGFNAAGPDQVTKNVALFDPFVLPYRSGVQQIDTSTTELPFKNQIIMPVAAAGAEAIAFYTTETGGKTTIYQDILSEPASGPNGALTVGAPTALESNLNGSIVALYDGYTNFNANDVATPAMTSYSLAWAVYDGSNYNAQFQIFSPGGTPTGGVGTVESLTGLGAATLAPAWEFRNAGALSDHGLSVPYASVLAVADGTHNGQQDVQFQGYNADGSANPDSHFLITPDLSHFLPGATNQITQPSTGASLLYTPNGVSGSGFSVAWSETVTDGNGPHTQVEFAIFHPSGFNSSNQFGSGQLVSHSTFQVPDAQNIRIVSAAINGASVEYLAYGDATSTVVVEFDATGHQLATIVDRDHSVTYSDLEVMGDGRIALTYPDSAQYTTDIFDLRETGLVNPSLSTTSANYVAGTHFSDTVTGANNDTNFYYFVGQDTATSAPTDHFNGGTGASAWNEAVFADARADYTISTAGSVTTLTNIDPQHAHAGTLIVDQNVQALAFNPTRDPAPNPDGSIEASGDTLLVLSPFAHAAQIDAGATLEFVGADSGSVTFNAPMGTLKLDDPAHFSGQIAGISAAGDVLDLHGFAAATTTAVTGSNSYNSTSNTTTLTVTDSSDQRTETFTLAGNLSGSAWTASDDHHGGVNIVDPPASGGQGAVDTMVQATAPIPIQTTASAPNQNLTSTGAGTTDNFVFNFAAVGHDTVTDFRPSVDSLQFAGSLFTDPQAALNATQDDGHGNTVIALDPHDTITLTGVLKAQLHVTDFHVV
jgi:hypothetical protein